MQQASELTHVSPCYAIWQAYDRTVKAELFSTAVRIESGVVVIDPIPLLAEARVELQVMGNISAVLLTDANHARAAADFADADSLFVPAELVAQFPLAKSLSDGMRVRGLNAIAIEGAAPGEFAFHDGRDGGTLIIGDALINFEPHGFTLLPAKYCIDRKEMIRSLRRLLDLAFTRIFFAHGSPIVAGARKRLTALLDELS
jgi:glyoxylase-like metal-dependent hydrolase (beta-lactamase superfamily II)